ncbi:MAG: acyltransferase [Actinobacteria bacterium]|nr:acyltransferase [Actinomycetota bacterium]
MFATRTEQQPMQSNAAGLGYFGPFDGIRGIGMIMVLLAHLSYASFSSFAVAVDMFFVISGFLITTLLLEEHDRSARIDMGNFFWRRAFRLFPMLYATLIATVLGAWASGHRDLLDRAVNDAASAAFYVYHVVHPVGIEIETSRFPEHRPLIQLWSLSVEEHFYLIAAFMTLFVVRRNLAKPLIGLFLGGWAFIAVARLTGHVGPRFAWYQRPDSLMIGTALAYVHALLPAQLSESGQRALRAAGAVAVAVLGITILVGTKLVPYRLQRQFSPYDGTSRLTDDWYWGRFGFSIANLCLGILVLTMVRNRDWIVNRFLSLRGFRAIGVRSYCLYLLHVPLAVVLFETFAEINPDTGDFAPSAGLAGGYLVALVVLTEVCHRFIEQPMIAYGKRFVKRRRTRSTATA